MSDYDRGAYTPQTDAPLAFDPRRPSERRPMPMALIGSAVVLVVLLAGVAMVYRGGVRHAGESPRPVGEPVMAVKTAPPPSASTSAPPANLDVYNAGEDNTAAPSANQTGASAAGSSPSTATQSATSQPTFVAPAEQPAARPAPKASTVAMLAKPSAPTQIERRPTPTESAASAPPPPAKLAAAPAKKTPSKATVTTVEKTTTSEKTETSAKTAPTAPAHHAAPRTKVDESELAAAGMTRPANDEAASDTAPAPAVHKAKPVQTAAPTSESSAAATPSATGKAVVQIGAFSSSALADKGYADVSATLPSQMGGKAKHVQSLDKDGATLYRTWLSGFATRADAQAFCDALKAKGKTCLVRG